MPKTKTVDQLADVIIQIMQNTGLTPDEMLEVLKMVKEKLLILKNKKDDRK